MKILNKILTSQIPKYLLAAVLIIVPLYPKFPLFAVSGTYVAIRYEDLILLVLAVLTFLKIIKDRNKFLKDELVIASLFFLGIGLLSLLSGIFITQTVGMSIGLLNYLRRIEYLIPFFAALYLFNKTNIRDNLSFFVKILIVITIVAFVYGLCQRYFHFPIIITQNDTYSRGLALRWTPGGHISSTFAGHYDLAAFMVMLLPIFIGLFFSLKNKWNKFWLFISIIGGLWLLVNSLSRISQVSYLVAVSVALILARKFKVLGMVFIISVLLIGRSSSLNERFMRVFDVYYQKIKIINKTSLLNNFTVHAESEVIPTLRTNLPVATQSPKPVFEDRSTSIRLVVEWPRALRAFKINPLLGTGYSSISLATDNDFLRMLGEVGLLGLLSFGLVFLRIGKIYVKSINIIKNMPPLEFCFIVGVIGAIVGTFISATFIDLFEASKFATIFWLMIGYSVSLIRSYDNE